MRGRRDPRAPSSITDGRRDPSSDLAPLGHLLPQGEKGRRRRPPRFHPRRALRPRTRPRRPLPRQPPRPREDAPAAAGAEGPGLAEVRGPGAVPAGLRPAPHHPLHRHGGASPARAEGVEDAPGGRAAARQPQAVLDSLRPAGRLGGKAVKGRAARFARPETASAPPSLSRSERPSTAPGTNREHSPPAASPPGLSPAHVRAAPPAPRPLLGPRLLP